MSEKNAHRCTTVPGSGFRNPAKYIVGQAKEDPFCSDILLNRWRWVGVNLVPPVPGGRWAMHVPSVLFGSFPGLSLPCVDLILAQFHVMSAIIRCIFQLNVSSSTILLFHPMFQRLFRKKKPLQNF